MDKKLLSELYTRFYRELYLYVYSLCANREISEDVLQETFVKAILSLPENHTNIRAWLYLVARNLCLNQLKRSKQTADLESIRELPARDADVIEKIIRDENKLKLYKAIQSLGFYKREVIVLQYFGGLSQKEISGLLHISPENVRVLSYRGKKEIKKYMEADGYDI